MRWKRREKLPLTSFFLHLMFLPSSFGLLRNLRLQHYIGRNALRKSHSRCLMMSSESGLPKVVVIAGPTAVGKSDVAARICAEHKGILISADSVQAYQGVQIGANKPTKEDLEETPHLLVDVANHTEAYNAAEWRRDALLCIQSLSQSKNDMESDGSDSDRMEVLMEAIQKARTQKGYGSSEPLLPVVCGGTMMYLQWLVHGRPDAMKPSENALRKAKLFIDECIKDNDWKRAVSHANSLGDVFASRVSKFPGEDWYRMRRTLEVAYTAKERQGEDSGLVDELYSGIRLGDLASLGYDIRCFFLCPDDRMNHTQIVDTRCEQMLQRGLLKETCDLLMGGTMPDMARRAIGYRQVIEYLEAPATETTSEEDHFGVFLDNFTTATRRYAKKQMSWFRKDGNFVFIPVSIAGEKSKRVTEASDEVTRILGLPREAYEKELQSIDSTSSQMKIKNEKQGAKMKFYQIKRQILKNGSPELQQVLEQGKSCRNVVAARRRRRDD